MSDEYEKEYANDLAVRTVIDKYNLKKQKSVSKKRLPFLPGR